MNNEPQQKRNFWPALFLGAFVIGAVLWGVWMYNIVQKTRQQQQNGFFVPTAPNQTNPSAMTTNIPAARTNSAVGNTNGTN